MSRDDDAKNLRHFDVRVVERNIKKGLITRKDIDKHLKALPDASDKICPPSERSPELTGVYGSAAPRVEASVSAGAAADDQDDDDEDDDDDDDAN